MPRRLASRGTERVESPDAASVSVVHPAPPDRVTATIPAKFRGRARRDAAAFYLSELAKGVLAGELGVLVGDRRVDLAAAEFVILEIDVKQKKRANHVAVKLKWPRRPLIRVAIGNGE